MHCRCTRAASVTADARQSPSSHAAVAVPPLPTAMAFGEPQHDPAARVAGQWEARLDRGCNAHPTALPTGCAVSRPPAPRLLTPTPMRPTTCPFASGSCILEQPIRLERYTSTASVRLHLPAAFAPVPGSLPSALNAGAQGQSLCLQMPGCRIGHLPNGLAAVRRVRRRGHRRLQGRDARHPGVGPWA
jgi:hypothetical protein